MDMRTKIPFDPSKIKDPYNLLAALLLIVESLFGYLLYLLRDTPDPDKLVIIGFIMALIFIVFMIDVLYIVREQNEQKTILKQESDQRSELPVETPLFCWDSVPGDHNEKLIRYLRNNFGIGWVEKAEICKCSDGMTISISTDANSAEIKLSDTKEIATLEISDGSYGLEVREENGKLNIYGKPPALTEATVEFCTRKEDVEKKMTDLLKETNESLYYYGGAGFIGSYPPWKQELDVKLKDENVKIVRLVDLKTPKEMEKILKPMKNEEVINREVDKYTGWLRLHAENLKSRIPMNAFYSFDGASLWKYGIHQIIFDKKHVVIVFLSGIEGEVRNAIFIRNSTDIAGALVKSIDLLVAVLGLTSITTGELEKITAIR